MIDVNLNFRHLPPAEFAVAEGAQVLYDLFAALQANARGGQDALMHLKLDEGQHSELVFMRSELLSIETNPAVDVATYLSSAPADAAPRTLYPAPLIVKDQFLPAEDHQDLLRLVAGHASPNPGDSVAAAGWHAIDVSGETLRAFHSDLRQQAPSAAHAFGIELDYDCALTSRLERQGENQPATDPAADPEPRPEAIGFEYYFSPEPTAFVGGALQFFDFRVDDQQRDPADSFRTVPPADNRLVLFPGYARFRRRAARGDDAGAQSLYRISGWLG